MPGPEREPMTKDFWFPAKRFGWGWGPRWFRPHGAAADHLLREGRAAPLALGRARMSRALSFAKMDACRN